MSDEKTISAFRAVPRTGVIFVTTEASRCGYAPNDEDWCNLGQGQPETGPLPGAPDRVKQVPIDVDDCEYSPTAGLWELREAVASLYNSLYRRGMKSQYKPENVCIAGGGRSLLTRAAASLGSVNLGHFLPDYTAYEELLDIFKAFTAIPILLDGENGYNFSSEDLRKEIQGRGLSALLFSNPCNPTGRVVEGEEMQKWCSVARQNDCSLLVDEFYSHYLYRSRPGQVPMVSAASCVEDVDKDPVVLFDGFTKNWRYPGWRVAWALGPQKIAEALASAGSFLDGGGSKPLQRAAIGLVSNEHVMQETHAIQECFRAKRNLIVPRLENLGVKIDRVPEGTFYVWGSVADLAPPFQDGMSFFREALKHKVIVVPGEFFDVNPGKRRRGSHGRFKGYVRFSFGPNLKTVALALDRLDRMVKASKS